MNETILDQRYHIIVTLMGNLERQSSNRIKYGHLVKALERKVEVVEVYDATLRGVNRWLNAIRVFHPNRSQWQQRYYKNVPAFRKRSQQVTNYLASMRNQVDAVIQLGTLIDACWEKGSVPGIIYTDYTAQLSAQKPGAGRSPFSTRERQQWLELEGQAFQHAAFICARSSLVRDSIVNDYNILPDKVSVIGGGVNFDHLPSRSPRGSDRPPTAMFIGKEFHRKGGDLLLRAFAQARKKNPAARLIMVTGESIPSELPLAGVEIIQPTWDRTFVGALFEQADLFVLPSRLETWGDVLLEAMAYELPCIGVAGDAMDEIILHHETGLIVPREDIDSLAWALDLLFAQPDLRQEWGRNGRRRIEEQFTWDHIAGKLAQVIHKVLE